MNARRTNKSHRVPNVKLRPAHPSSSKSSRNPNSYPSSLSANQLAQPSQQDSDVAFVDPCPRPFQGVVLCATGISDKTSLFKQALELGAGHHNHFTDRVTHLIADEHGGAKYNCAVQMKIPIMKSSWITESHEIWLRGDDVNFEQSLAKHRLPIFIGVVLCLSGIDDIDRRIQINRTVSEQMGTFVKNIERPVKVTHLLCSGDEATDKMKYAEKFNQRGESDIKLVWEEWFWDCVNFGGRFEESEYLVSRPRPEPKSSPSNLLRSSSPQVRQQSSHPATPPPESSLSTSPAPAPDPDGEEELASVQRVPHVTLQLWENLLGPRGFEIVEGKLKRSPTKSKSQDVMPDEDPCDDFALPIQKPLHTTEKSSLLSNFKRLNSFAPAVKDTLSQQSQRRQPFSRIATVGPADSFLGDLPPPSTQPVPSGNDSGRTISGKRLFFEGKRFRALGEARCLNVKTVVEGGGGSWVVEDDDDVDFTVVRLVSGSKFFRDEGDEGEKTKYRTECWLERCNYEERVCEPEEHVTFRPLGIDTPVHGAEDVNLSFSGLDQSEACWIRRFVRAIGVNLAQNFSRRSTHLLCPSSLGAKYDKAKEWNVPVIDMSWMKELARTGIIPPTTSSSSDDVCSAATDVETKDEKRDVVDESANDDPGQQPEPSRLHDESRVSFGPSNLLLGHSVSEPDQRPSDTQPIQEEQMQERSSSLDYLSVEKLPERIPSSASPSPMKIGDSPLKNSQLDQQATKKLQDSITNLLGKRRSLAEETTSVVQQGRAAKRTRPMARTKSSSKAAVVDNDSFVYDTLGTSGHLFVPSPLDDENEDGTPEEGRGPKEETVRVMYEDPRQREEKKRLMSLLGSGDGERPGVKIVKRSSQRMAGF